MIQKSTSTARMTNTWTSKTWKISRRSMNPTMFLCQLPSGHQHVVFTLSHCSPPRPQHQRRPPRRGNPQWTTYPPQRPDPPPPPRRHRPPEPPSHLSPHPRLPQTTPSPRLRPRQRHHQSLHPGRAPDLSASKSPSAPSAPRLPSTVSVNNLSRHLLRPHPPRHPRLYPRTRPQISHHKNSSVT